MTALETFFAAWGESDAATRGDLLSACLDPHVVYADPRTPEPLSGPQAVTDYVAMFSANAPGWTARVVKQDETAGLIRATVAFGGMGPDGSEMVQHGQYFVEGTKTLTRITGFVGTGAPE